MNDSTLLFAFWVRDGKWEFRIDTPHLPHPLGQRHIHVRRRRGGKGEFIWNVDGSRHDKHKFPPSDAQIKRAREIAGEYLRVDPVSLQFITSLGQGMPSCVVATSEKSGKETRIVVGVRKSTLVFGSEYWLVIIGDQEEE